MERRQSHANDSDLSEVPKDAYKVYHHIQDFSHKTPVRHYSESGVIGCHQTSPHAISKDYFPLFFNFFFHLFFVVSTKALLQCYKKSQKLGENKIWKLKLRLPTAP